MSLAQQLSALWATGAGRALAYAAVVSTGMLLSLIVAMVAMRGRIQWLEQSNALLKSQCERLHEGLVATLGKVPLDGEAHEDIPPPLGGEGLGVADFQSGRDREPCDRAVLLMQKAQAEGWASFHDAEQFEAYLRAALDLEARAGGPFKSAPRTAFSQKLDDEIPF